MPKKYSFAREELEELYINQKLSVRQIASHYKCSHHTISRHLVRFNISLRTKSETLRIRQPQANPLSQSQIEQLCQEYQSGMTVNQLAKKYKISGSGSHDSVTEHLKKNNVTIRPRCTDLIYHCNEGFFDTIDSETKAYWLGFLAADGCVSIPKRGQARIMLRLSTKDRHHIQRFLDALDSDKPIYSTTSDGMSQAHLSSNRLAKSLAQYGIIPRKSLVLTFPSLPYHLTHHFIRGNLDGDGHITMHKNKVTVGFTCGSEIFLSRLQDWLVQHCKITKNSIYHRFPHNAWSLQYSCAPAKNLIAYLYSDATIYLNRKWEVARQSLGYNTGNPKQIISHYLHTKLITVINQWILETNICYQYTQGDSACNIARRRNTYAVLIYRILERNGVPRRSAKEAWASWRRRQH